MYSLLQDGPLIVLMDLDPAYTIPKPLCSAVAAGPFGLPHVLWQDFHLAYYRFDGERWEAAMLLDGDGLSGTDCPDELGLASPMAVDSAERAHIANVGPDDILRHDVVENAIMTAQELEARRQGLAVISGNFGELIYLQYDTCAPFSIESVHYGWGFLTGSVGVRPGDRSARRRRRDDGRPSVERRRASTGRPKTGPWAFTLFQASWLSDLPG